jgi:ribosome production factor 1
MFPDAQFAKRGSNHEMRQIIKVAIERGFTDMLVVNEDRKTPSKWETICIENE